jgi:hypothetical protein
MNEAYQEHLDHIAGSASEFQNCYTEAGQAMRAHNYQTDQSVAALVAAGSFVVVASDTWHCRATDAVVGEGRYLRSHWDTREEADAAVRRAYDADGPMFAGEVGYDVEPRLPVPLVDLVMLAPDDEEVPF